MKTFEDEETNSVRGYRLQCTHCWNEVHHSLDQSKENGESSFCLTVNILDGFDREGIIFRMFDGKDKYVQQAITRIELSYLKVDIDFVIHTILQNMLNHLEFGVQFWKPGYVVQKNEKAI